MFSRSLSPHRILFGRAIAIAAAVCVTGLTGCADNGSGVVSTTPVTTLTIATSPGSSVTTAQTVTATITLSAGSGTSSAGSVVLSSGNYASFPTTLSAGQATITFPAALLAVGSDTLTATYMLTGSSTSAATATAALTVASASTPVPVVTSTTTTVPTMAAGPFKALQTTAGNLLVSESTGIEVFTPAAGGGFQSSCMLPLNSSFLADQDSVFGFNLTPNGKALAAAIVSDGVLLYPSVDNVLSCNEAGLQVSQGPVSAGEGTFDVAITPDGKYAFVANEDGMAGGSNFGGNVGVVSLQYDSSGNLTGGTLVGEIATAGNTIAGVTISHDGTRLYVTSEGTPSYLTNPGAGNPVLTKDNCVQKAGSSPKPNGLLTVMSVATAETNPGPAAIISMVNAGCSPVRTVETADSTTLWVSARGDGNVLAFSTGMLELNPANALLGSANTGGTAPVGLQLFGNDKLLAVANSNRFTVNGAGTTNVAIMSVAVPSNAGVVQTIPEGTTSFPREITLAQDGATLLATKFGSAAVEIITTSVH